MVLNSCKNEGNYEPVVTAIHSSGQQFVSSESCIECHKTIFENHIETAHYLSSSLASSGTIGDFTNGSNSLTINDSLEIKITEKDNSYYHTAINTNTKKIFDQQKIDIVIGSGTKGKAYLYWKNDSLYQLHASYFAATHSLIKSPGYSFRVGLQNKRPITERCLECHTTYVKTKPNLNTYKRSQTLLGIDCQRCHGPAEQHVVFHKNNPDESASRHLLEIASSTRQQQMDLCALCHSGARKKAIKSRFSYLVGDPLNRSSNQDFFSTARELDVHGNQVGMLKASACFKKSDAMTCTTCHDPHKNQRNAKNYFIQKCLECHQKSHDLICSLPDSEKKEDNCVTCHMPRTVSKTMFAKSQITKDTAKVEVVSHLIAIYEKKIE